MEANTVTTLSFDDDKIRSRGKDAKDLDLESAYQRGGKAGPTLLAVVQNSTGPTTRRNDGKRGERERGEKRKKEERKRKKGLD